MGLIRHEQIAGMNCHYYNYSLDYFLDSMERNEYKSVALWGGAPHFFLDYEEYSDCGEIKKKARERNIDIVCFTPSSGTYGYQMCMEPESHRERVKAYYLNGVRATVELGASLMSMNSGWGYWNEPESDAWKRSVEMIWDICEFAGREGVTLTMESLRRAESQLAYNLENTRRMYMEISHPALKIMIDTTAMAVAGESIEEWFQAFGDEIVNTHFIDNNPYGHLVWGDGTANLEEYLMTLSKHNYTGPLGLEITAGRYYENPTEADEKNMRALSKYI